MIIILKMKYIVYVIGSILVLLIFILLFTQIHSTSTYISEKTIVIDPGHGGRDPGANGNSGITEKDINLYISLKLKTILEQNGYTVVLTRDKDVALHDEGAKKKKASDIANRKKIITDSGASMLVSIHLNSFPEEKYYGAQVFYPPNSENSKLLGEFIQDELKNQIDTNNDRKAKTINTILLLKGLNIPAVIVECGFLSNPKEEQLLTQDDYQQKLAEAIYSGIIRYLSIPTIYNTQKVAL